VLDFLGSLERTHLCGELRAANAGQQVVLMGWVNRRRDHGSLIFLDVRDRSGIAQVVLDKDLIPEGHAKGEQIRPEYVVAAVGKVRLRDAEGRTVKWYGSNTDISERKRDEAELKRHLADFAGPCLLVTHDPLEALVLADQLIVLEGGRIVVSHLVRTDFADVGAVEPYSEGIIDYLRAVEGAELAVLIREPPRDDGPLRRISLRASVDELDVSAIARLFGGGGHRQAAGFSSEKSIDEITELVRQGFVSQRAPASA